MKVWILQTGEPLHCDGGAPRPMRAMNLANALIERGHSVVIWSSGFYHQQKRHRCREFESRVINEKFIINLVPSMGYKRNIGLGRLIDHAQLAWRLSRLLKSKKFSPPDIAFIGYPPIEAAAVMLNWLKERHIPAIIDVKDQWPALFLEPFPKVLHPIIKFLLMPYFYYARSALTNATAFSTMSQGYLEWMSRFSRRKLHDLDMVIPLTTPIYEPSAEEYIEAERWWNEHGVSTLTNRRFCFVGSFMSVFDFSGIRDVADRFQSEGVDCQFVICGDGGFATDIRSMMSGLDNVIFPGWIDAPKIAALAKFSSGSLIPYKNIDNFILNTPNKVIDAFAHGLPVITTLTGEVENIVEMENVGFACNANTGRDMYSAMMLLLNDQEFQNSMSKRARTLYDRRFAGELVYGGLVDALERIS
jgi:glycosyltransferase involved in cell wall biosynthesis